MSFRARHHSGMVLDDALTGLLTDAPAVVTLLTDAPIVNRCNKGLQPLAPHDPLTADPGFRQDDDTP